MRRAHELRGAWRLPFLICGHSRNAGAGVPINSPAGPHKGKSAAPSPAPEDAPLNRGRGKIGQETGFPVHKDRLLATSSGARRLERRLKLTFVLRRPLASPPLLWERKRVLTFAPDPQECSSIWLEHRSPKPGVEGSSPSTPASVWQFQAECLSQSPQGAITAAECPAPLSPLPPPPDSALARPHI